MEISIKESTMVFPAKETPEERLWVSNLDLVQIRFHPVSVYFYNKPDGSSNFFDTQVLKDALSEILVPFYPAAGRLQYDEDGRLEIMCNGKGVLFIEAEASCVMDDLVRDFTDSSRVPDLAPKVDYSGGISSYPLVALQVTTFKCGGVSVGVALQHTLADGPSALHFINSWADRARGLPLEVPPFLNRTILKARSPPTPKFNHIEFDPSPPLKNPVSGEPKPSVVSLFKITNKQLNTLKSKINEKFSSYSILAAHIWRCVTKARGLTDDQQTRLFMPIDGRRRLDPPCPPGYFGNVIVFPATLAQANDLEFEPFSETVRRISKVLRETNDDYLRSTIDYIETVDDISSVVRGPHVITSPSLTINSWVWLPVHDADFGWGRPLFMRPANVVLEGIVLVLPSPTDDGSLTIVARLETSHTKVFEKLLYDI
ncbi:Transferase [Corchorus olitorius]|uniref:Transferase n=1 Tax=Corchorus olitorius TaxID=93759 RepID=A0A1R3HIG7_9ROSI|nr:Transferase [Corchorus olitorius]